MTKVIINSYQYEVTKKGNEIFVKGSESGELSQFEIMEDGNLTAIYVGYKPKSEGPPDDNEFFMNAALQIKAAKQFLNENSEPELARAEDAEGLAGADGLADPAAE